MGFLQFSDGRAVHVSDEPNTWPDGHYIHGHNVLVKLSCGHYRVSRGWRGSAGEAYRCDACKRMTSIMATVITNDEPHDWRTPHNGPSE